MEKAYKNAESSLKGYEKQAAQRRAENKMTLTVVELKQANKQLETKEARVVHGSIRVRFVPSSQPT